MEPISMKFSNKLSLSILVTGVVVLILSAFTLYSFSYNSIIKLQLTYAKSIADEVSGDIDHLLFEKVKTALTLANTPIIKNALEASNFSYANLSDEKRKESIKCLNEKWKSTKNPADNFILKFTDNKVSHFLKNQPTLLKGEYGEIFLTNKFGALVASTAMLSTLAHGHKYWWLGSYSNGAGAVFFDDRGYDDSVGGYVLGLVVPIRNGTEIIGILKCNLNILGSIGELISGAGDKLIGKFKLTRSGGMVVFEEGFEPLSTQVHGSILEKLKSKNNGSFIINDSGEKYIVGCSEIRLTKGGEGYGFGGTFESIDHIKGNTGESWYVLCYRQMSVALAPVTESVKSIALIGMAIIVILVLVSYLFGRKIAKPLTILDKAAEKIGKGDFEYRIDVRRKDEFGILADSFNSMAGKLQQTTTSVELLEDEIKHRKQMEEELLKAKKLESLGVLAGGIAHDFNNLMSAVVGNISLARMEMNPGSKGFKNLVEAEKASIQTKALTARLITFSKGGKPVKKTVSMGDLVKDSVDVSLKGSGINVRFSIPDDILPVAVDEDQMKQAIHNIVTNAREAMAEQGTINVSCENVDIGEKDPLTLKDGKYVKISIEDQGPGIPEEDRIKIFDPYFSTKEMGTQKGMGLGLSVSDSIVTQHEGLITVKSELGIGTTFSIYLPAASAESQAPSAKPLDVHPQSSINNQQSTIQNILVMDDEELVRDVFNALLTHLGHKVAVAVEGIEAIEMYQEAMASGKPFDVVILDLTNKVGMGGAEAIVGLLEIDPDVKAIVTTGYSNDPIISNFRDHGFSGALPKPSTVKDLKTALRDAIAGP
jgi:signal transduction histidine kinase/ActR/RegA family two-component response regulator